MTELYAFQNDGPGITLTADAGTMRLILEQARVSCQSVAMAPQVSTDLKSRWGNRASMLGSLVAQLPPPADPREPYGNATTKVTDPELAGSTDLEIAAAGGMLEAPSELDLDDLLA